MRSLHHTFRAADRTWISHVQAGTTKSIDHNSLVFIFIPLCDVRLLRKMISFGSKQHSCARVTNLCFLLARRFCLWLFPIFGGGCARRRASFWARCRRHGLGVGRSVGLVSGRCANSQLEIAESDGKSSHIHKRCIFQPGRFSIYSTMLVYVFLLAS